MTFAKKTTVMIDMDDVLVGGGRLHLINEFLGTSYTEADFIDYFMEDVIPEAMKPEWRNFFFARNQYAHCELLPHAYEVLEKINASGRYQIYIGTSYIEREDAAQSGIVLRQKFEYLTDAFPFLTPANFVFIIDKSLLNCDIKIDDRIDNLANARRKIMFRAYHNRNERRDRLAAKGIEVAEDWQEIGRLLLK